MRQKDSTSITRSDNKNDGEKKKKVHSFWSTLRQPRTVSTAGTKQKSSSTTTTTLHIVSQLEKNAAKTEAVRRNSTSTYTSRDATSCRTPSSRSIVTVTSNLPRRRRSTSFDRSSSSIEGRDSRSTSVDRKQRGRQSRDRQQDNDNSKTNGITSITRSGRSRSSAATHSTSGSRSRSTSHDQRQQRERSTSRDTNKSTGRQRSSSGNSKRRSNSSTSKRKTRNTKQPKSKALSTTMHHICDFKFTDILEMIVLDWDDTEDTKEKKVVQQNKQQQSLFGAVALCSAMTSAMTLAAATTTPKTQSSTNTTATTTVTPTTTTTTTTATPTVASTAASTATRALPVQTTSTPIPTTSTVVQTIHDPSAVTIAVEAAVVWKKRELDYMIESNVTPVLHDEKVILLSTNVVGFARDCNPTYKEYGIEKGERVGSIMPWAGRLTNPNIPIPVKYLVPVPRNFDSCDIVCILSYYLPAFEALHHGRIDDGRYSRTRFVQNRILINACNSICITPMIKAIIKLSKYAGCTEVYVIAPLQEHVEIRQLDIVMVLDDDHPDHWLPVVKGQMDLVIDFSFPNEFHYIRKALNPKSGRIVCYPSWGHGINSHVLQTNDKKSELTYFYEYCQLATMKHASIFDFNQHLDTYRDEVMDDINFLFHMLDLRQVRPEFVRYNNIQTVIKHATQNIVLQVLNENNRIDNEQESGGNGGGAIIFEPTRTSLKTINIDYVKNL